MPTNPRARGAAAVLRTHAFYADVECSSVASLDAMGLEDFVVGDELGSGSYATVFRVRRRESSEEDCVGLLIGASPYLLTVIEGLTSIPLCTDGCYPVGASGRFPRSYRPSMRACVPCAFRPSEEWMARRMRSKE